MQGPKNPGDDRLGPQNRAASKSTKPNPPNAEPVTKAGTTQDLDRYIEELYKDIAK